MRQASSTCNFLKKVSNISLVISHTDTEIPNTNSALSKASQGLLRFLVRLTVMLSKNNS